MVGISVFRSFHTGRHRRFSRHHSDIGDLVGISFELTRDCNTFAALKDARADTDLHTILTRGNIGEAPPPEMLQPLNLRFSLNIKR